MLLKLISMASTTIHFKMDLIDQLHLEMNCNGHILLLNFTKISPLGKFFPLFFEIDTERIIMATLTQEKKPVIPKLAQDLIAGTIGGWAQVAVGKLQGILQSLHRDF